MAGQQILLDNPGRRLGLPTMPCSSTPAGPGSAAVFPPDVAFRLPDVVCSREDAISGLNSKAYKLPVYASRPGLLQSAQHSVPAVSTLGRTGLVTRRVPIEGFSAPCVLLLQAWPGAPGSYIFSFSATKPAKTMLLKQFCRHERQLSRRKK